jgi:hypothetical protein
MATILLGAAGAALGAGFGGTVLGLSGAVIGRAIGATLGRVIDQRLMGAGSEPVEAGRVDRFRLMGASEGAPVGRVQGRMRVGGQVIWATRFQENTQRRGGGKGMPQPRVTEFSYSVSLAVALCEGEILGVGRIWADGAEIAPADLALRVYTGSEDQLPDPRIEAVEGAGQAPAYRGIAYVVIEDMALAAYGNRVPQLSFEVIRAVGSEGLQDAVQAVALMPGTGEYTLATRRVSYGAGPGQGRVANVNTPSGLTDMESSLDQLRRELPRVQSVSVIVSWFGDDLRCGDCRVRPKVEQSAVDGTGMPWRAGGIARAEAVEIARLDGRSVYGGSPADGAVIEAIQAIRAGGQAAMFYPFMLMEQLAGNGRPDPWTGADDQPALPWRGRITTSVAPGRAGSPDGTAAAEAEVAAFFGTAAPGDFAVDAGRIVYTGPDEWCYRRFILHYAHLCALAGGIDAFCIGSEMRSLTQIRGAGGSYPAVAAMRVLAAEVRAIMGPGTKIGYAADWTEYFGHHSGGDVRFHLDPLWSDAAIDFVGIDNYMPLSDWRDGVEHADAAWGSIHDPAYLRANVVGGEYHDWYYDSPDGRAAQRRLPIEDGAYGEPWVFRLKDLKGWWSNPHHDRLQGVRQAQATGWVPMSKPIWFTEYGCAAIDKGANEPNKFLDPKSSESALPVFSSGRRDDLMQMEYLRAIAAYWDDPDANPVSPLYGGRMLDMGRAHVWAWDARPFPAFPNAREIWSDGENFARGHWVNGRVTNQPLSDCVAEICARSGVVADVSGLRGLVRGYLIDGVGTGRADLQPLMLAQGFDAVERGGLLSFRMRGRGVPAAVDPGWLAVSGALEGAVETHRAPEAEVAGRVRVLFPEAEGDFALRQEEAIFPDATEAGVSLSELPLLLTGAEGRAISERWLAEARVARDGARMAFPPSRARLGAGDLLALEGALYRIDRLESGPMALVEAVRVEPAVWEPSDAAEARPVARPYVAPAPVFPVFLDLPLMTGEEVPHAPHLAVAASPWPGSVAVWSAAGADGFDLNTLIAASAAIGVTETPLVAARPGLWDRGTPLRVRMTGGALASASAADVLNGANLMAIGDGSSDRWELFQFGDADLVAPGTWDLSRRLRGQAGTDAIMPAVWPTGSLVVRLDGAPRQVALALSARGLVRTWRIGIAARGLDAPEAEERQEAFAGNRAAPLVAGASAGALVGGRSGHRLGTADADRRRQLGLGRGAAG